MPETLYKVLTHDLRSPIQRGEPIFNGSLPFVLPKVKVDESKETCAAGWNACKEGHIALKIGGLWPNGHPSRLFRVETDHPVIVREDKCRFSTGTLVEEILDVRPHFLKMSEFFGDLAEEITEEQMAWRAALARPGNDPKEVEEELKKTLEIRGLKDWTLKQFPTARAARAAWADWADWAARADRDAWAARAALTVWYAAKRKWIKGPDNLLTAGLREAYMAGLEIAIPTGKTELGWAMK